ncbi:MAG: phosphotransferase [Akkermansia sp.]|nr:phosphotransferase [Akkermansia sp.]
MKKNVLLGSGIVQEAISIHKCSAAQATHFVLCNHNKIKFIINLSDGLIRIRSNSAVYNYKLAILLRSIPFIRYKTLALFKIGYFAKIELNSKIAQYIPENNLWNIFVGTYDDVQKIVIQCYSQNNSPCTFIKVGNASSLDQMQREIKFLRERHTYTNLNLPTYISSSLISEESPFNILITKEIQAAPIQSRFTKELFQITREIAQTSSITKDSKKEFTHGDFAPWNIRKNADGYTIFDWEHCGMRPVGYDAVYFIMMTEIALKHSDFDTAFNKACEQIYQLDKTLKINKQEIYNEFTKTTKELIF